ncbi:MAG: hypothetical protein NXH85_14700 [Pseudomonadaceae bacterium]|nr:hypothetical protein [Pseudomonadaceae bacterium]
MKVAHLAERLGVIGLCLIGLLVTGCARAEAPQEAARLLYEVDFSAHFQSAEGVADVAITVRQTSAVLRELKLRRSASMLAPIGAAWDSTEVDASNPDQLIWQVPKAGGELRFRITVDEKRGGAFDARLTDEWALGRLGDLFPPASVRTLKNARSVSRMRLTASEDDWSFETRYGPAADKVIELAGTRNFNRPTGWYTAGDIGVRRAVISGRRVAVAAPVASGYRRMDTLAFLQWTLPELFKVFPEPADRLLIVGAPASFWRGGLSGPNSLYVHEARPLISENGTSTLLHELVHVASGWIPAEGDDWLVEGLAEYYAIELLRRSGGATAKRMQRTLDTLAQWAKAENASLADPSTGANTAAAALMFAEIDAELSGRLDDVVASMPRGSVSREDLGRAIQQVLGKPSEVLSQYLRANR